MAKVGVIRVRIGVRVRVRVRVIRDRGRVGATGRVGVRGRVRVKHPYSSRNVNHMLANVNIFPCECEHYRVFGSLD